MKHAERNIDTHLNDLRLCRGLNWVSKCSSRCGRNLKRFRVGVGRTPVIQSCTFVRAVEGQPTVQTPGHVYLDKIVLLSCIELVLVVVTQNVQKT